jgi:hypothetical protein
MKMNLTLLGLVATCMVIAYLFDAISPAMYMVLPPLPFIFTSHPHCRERERREKREERGKREKRAKRGKIEER